MTYLLGFFGGMLVYSFYRAVFTGFYTIKPNERGVITSFGRAVRPPGQGRAVDPHMSSEEAKRYCYPAVSVMKPGGPYFKWPWQKIYKVTVSTEALDLTWDPTKNQGTLECVTKDNLTTGVNGQIRYRVNEDHLYAYLFGVLSPLEHVMGFFVSVLRERVAIFVDPKGQSLLSDEELEGEVSSVGFSEGVSINDLRKNLPLLNKYMEQHCRSAAGRYGVELDAALITEIDPPPEVDRALSSINSTRNQVAADISTARADAEQQITMSSRAVEIASNNAQAEVAPLKVLAETLSNIKKGGGASALKAYLRNMRVPLLSQAQRVIVSREQIK